MHVGAPILKFVLYPGISLHNINVYDTKKFKVDGWVMDSQFYLIYRSNAFIYFVQFFSKECYCS